MDELAEKIHIQYLREEIEKMQKTAKELEKMIDKKDPIKDDDLIEILQKIRSTTLDNIENKKSELNEIYNKNMKIDNN
jgi:hypothetical protein